MADEAPTKLHSPRRESEPQKSREREQDHERDRDDRPRRRSRSPRRHDDRPRDSDRDRNRDRRDDRPRDDRPRDDRRRDDRPRDDRPRDDRPPRDSRRGGGGGFKWKEKRPTNNDERDGGEKRLERGYRKRSRSPRRDRSDRPAAASSSVEDKFGVADKFGPSKSTSSSSNDKQQFNTDQPPQRAPAAPTQFARGEEMIIVHVNDRLGTKAAIPCLASDPIRLFKAQVAARIGRKPHEILLKRQGERPFKDQLTLEDYGVGNGVQIDLEIDTGE